jgi:hypothetical protein
MQYVPNYEKYGVPVDAEKSVLEAEKIANDLEQAVHEADEKGQDVSGLRLDAEEARQRAVTARASYAAMIIGAAKLHNAKLHAEVEARAKKRYAAAARALYVKTEIDSRLAFHLAAKQKRAAVKEAHERRLFKQAMDEAAEREKETGEIIDFGDWH